MQLDEALDIAQQTAFALSAAHAAGIIHRDIKPENIMLRRDGIVKVLDFGLAKLTEQHNPLQIDREADTRTLLQTDPGRVLGTLVYMSPEQARAQEIDERSDLWSLGCVIYEMVTGRKAFQRDTNADSLAAILNERPKPIAESCPDAPAELQRIINKTLQKRSAERYQHARDLLLDLRSLKQELEFRARLGSSSSSLE
jgi:eukaryotic-like serine/threonine-protein kinase